MSTISQLAPQVLARVEEPNPSAPVFWSLTLEVYSALVEALNDLMLLVGRPTQTIQVPLDLQPNSVWQSVPKGVLLITDMWGGGGTKFWRTDLGSMDRVMSSWSAAWENDTDPDGPVRWGPVGLTQFFVHPAPQASQQVLIGGVAYPVTGAWPYDGTQTVPFQLEFFTMLEQYAASYLRLKENGREFEEGVALYNSYLQLAQRMTQIQDSRDALIFSPVAGGVAGVNPAPRR